MAGEPSAGAPGGVGGPTPGPNPGAPFGEYQVLEELGKGGMGRVFRAHHVVLDRDVALKVLDEAVATDESFRLRFLKEARSAARLNHRNIVQIYDFGQVGGSYYLAMEFVRGRSLGAILRSSGPFSEREAIALTRDVCTALGVAHAAGIVHRDVKPDNLILTDDFTVKLVDLGLAKNVIEDPNATQTGMVAGTPHYISPEQIEGRRDIDGRADVYSLGATLFHLVTGRPPFEGSSPMVVIAKHLHEEPRDPHQLRPELSDALCAVIRRMMARDRDARYADMAAVDAALAEIGSTLTGRPAAVGESVRPTAASGSPAQSGAVTPRQFDSAVLAALENHLAAAIGPLARVLVRDAAKRSPDHETLCAEVARHVPSDAQRAAFLTAVRADAAWPRAQRSGVTERPVPPEKAGSSGPSPGSGPISGPTPFDPEALRALERLLAESIGPMARVEIKQAARRARSWDELVAAVSGSLPPGVDPAAFRAQAARLAR